MKVVRVPWIRCRADEVGSCSIDVQWRKQAYKIISHSEREAQEWWGGLRDEERDAAVVLNEAHAEQPRFW